MPSFFVTLGTTYSFLKSFLDFSNFSVAASSSSECPGWSGLCALGAMGISLPLASRGPSSFAATPRLLSTSVSSLRVMA